MCGFDRCTTVPRSFLALLSFPAFDTNAHTCSLAKCDKRITRRDFVLHQPQPPTTTTIKHKTFGTQKLKECNSHISLLMLPFKRLPALTLPPTHLLLCPHLFFSLLNVYFSSVLKIWHTVYPGDSPRVSKAQISPSTTSIYFPLSCAVWFIRYWDGWLCVCFFSFFFYGLNPNS